MTKYTVEDVKALVRKVMDNGGPVESFFVSDQKIHIQEELFEEDNVFSLTDAMIDHNYTTIQGVYREYI